MRFVLGRGLYKNRPMGFWHLALLQAAATNTRLSLMKVHTQYTLQSVEIYPREVRRMPIKQPWVNLQGTWLGHKIQNLTPLQKENV